MEHENGQKKPAPQKANKKGKNSFVSLVNWKWAVTAFFTSLSISVVLTLLSSEGLSYLNVFLSCLVLIFFIAIGVVFDIIGLAVATADKKPFLSMAARKVKGGKTAVNLIKNADRVSSFCNDVIGDISGVVSGSTAAVLALKIAVSPDSEFYLNLLLCGLVSAFTVGTKAVGKAAGMNYSYEIVLAVSKVLALFNRAERSAKSSSRKKPAEKKAEES